MSAAAKLRKLFTKPNQLGQGIIEIVVVLALATILILALVALSVRSNRASNFSRAEDQAARLAQEGMERIRNMRDSSTATVTPIGGGTPTDWNYIFDTDFSGDQIAVLCDGLCLNFTGSSETITIDTRVFTRTVIVSDDPVNPDDPATPLVTETEQKSCNNFTGPPDWEDVKQFTVEVTWIDSSGSHTSTTTSCLRESR